MKTSLAALLCSLVLPAHAAGGHHAVDDASILDPGQCQLEVWAEHSSAHALQHVGPACRAGAVEVALNLDRSTGTPSHIELIGPQLKWAREVAPGWSLGVAAGVNWQRGTSGPVNQWLLVPLTWQPRSDLLVHLNIGRDFRRQGPDARLRGIAMEWQPSLNWQGLLEWWDAGAGSHRRQGLRYLWNDQLSLDLSHAQAQGHAGKAWWTLGLNWTWQR